MATEEEARWKVGRVINVKKLGTQRLVGEKEIRMPTVEGHSVVLPSPGNKGRRQLHKQKRTEG